jgi:2-keto-4-pentenoate hydratase/2-oxohepta-3-ene-1,7-dioic acid hydratase in catechol pathway
MDGGEPWIVGSVYCLGKNYRAHAVEMGQTTPRPPVVFLKPAAALVPFADTLVIPGDRGEVHHEIELVLGLRLDPDQEGRPLTETEARGTIAVLGIGLDLTLRDEQARAKAAGEPWTASKGFAGSGPLSSLRPLGEVRLDDLSVRLEVDGEVRQAGRVSEMTLSPVASVMALSRRFPLASGDLVFTGTPAGVGPLVEGQMVTVALDPLLAITTRVRVSPAT